MQCRDDLQNRNTVKLYKDDNKLFSRTARFIYFSNLSIFNLQRII